VLRTRDRLSRYLEIFAVLEPEDTDRLVSGSTPGRELAREALSRWVGNAGSEDPLNDLLRVDARMSLAEDLLVVADHFSMRASVELRVPFLDLRLLELVERMPSRYKVSRLGERKWLYRQGVARILPPILARRLCGIRARVGRKQGFTTPLDRWFAPDSSPLGPMRTWMEPLATAGVCRGDALDALSRRALASGSRMQRELLALYALSRWVQSQ
jgi:asparagine synthase (glutamine-hydrolysing)